MTAKAGGEVAADEFIKFGGALAVAIFMGKVAIFKKAKSLLFYQILFIGGFGFDLAWFLSCFFLPLLWMDAIGIVEKIAVAIFYFLVCFFNVRLALKIFSMKWNGIGDAKFRKEFDVGQNCVDWSSVSKSMKLTAVIFVPGIPKKYEDLISVVMLFLIILGVALRSGSPKYSMVALSIPFSICAACCLQMSVYHFSEARMVRIIETRKSVKLRTSC